MRFIFIALVIAVLQVRITVAEERSSWLESKIQGKRFGGSVSVNQSIAEGIRLGARYKAESAPSYFPKFYTRIDQYSINADLLPGQVLSRSSGLPVGLGFSSGTEVTFARQFEKQLDSIKATPYGYDHLPFTAKTAREKLIAGDYVSFSSKMNLSGSVNSFVPAFGMLGGGAGAQLVASGEFQIQIFRMRNDLVRVRIISNRGNAKNLYAGVSAMPAFNLFQISMANSATNKLISALAPVNPLQVNMENGAEHLIVLDYVYDL